MLFYLPLQIFVNENQNFCPINLDALIIILIKICFKKVLVAIVFVILKYRMKGIFFV